MPRSRRTWPPRPRQQRGMAIVLAMLILALVVTLVSAMTWQQWRGIETEAGERVRARSGWLLLGISDWTRQVLRADARAGNTDSLDEPWSAALAQTRLSSLAAGTGIATRTDEALGGYLSGQIMDAQARLNVLDLSNEDLSPSPEWKAVFARLYADLGLDPTELAQVQGNLVLALRAQAAAAAGAAPPAGAPLLPRTYAQLAWLGFSADHLQRLRDYITVLPVRTPVNVNTAPVPVLLAVLGQLDQADLQALLAYRARTPISYDEQLLRMFPALKRDEGVAARIDTATHFFIARGSLRSERRTETDVTLLQRTGLDTQVLIRERLAGDAAALPPSAPTTAAR